MQVAHSSVSDIAFGFCDLLIKYFVIVTLEASRLGESIKYVT